MRVAVIGAGYVGLVTGACLGYLGCTVAVCDRDVARIADLRRGICPIYEPGLPERLAQAEDCITYHSDLGEAVDDAQVLVVCVGTPPGPDGEPDLTGLQNLAADLVQVVPSGNAAPVLALKSTVPVGTARRLSQRLGDRFAVVSNPEFLREGTAIADFFHPDRLVVGGPDPMARATVAALYAGIAAPLVEAEWEGAELIKYATNAYLAVKIAFVSEMAALCDGLEVNVLTVLQGLGLDARIGPHYLQPGPGYGGSCLPKDLAALTWMAAQGGVELDLLPAARVANSRTRHRLLARLAEGMDGLAGRTVAVWGGAFKAGTDDVRGSAALDLIPDLLAAGASVQAYDPVAGTALARSLPTHDRFTLCDSAAGALAHAHGLLILTEWPEFAAADPRAVREAMAGRTVVDARNLWSPAAAAAAGLDYRSLGRPSPRSAERDEP